MSAALPHPGPGLKILLVEDDPVTRRLARAVLELDGFEVVVAVDGEEGLRCFQEQSPDLVLTDYSMPGMTGAAFTRRLFEIQRNGANPLAALHVAPHMASVPVVVFTGHGEAEVLKECLQAGAADFLTKPFTVEELRTRIRATAELAVAQATQAAREAEEQDEIAVVKHVLGRLLEPGKAAMPAGFEMETLATRRINGDLCAYRAGAPGIHFGMLCDPMGHGLMAGISGIPALEVFNALSARNAPLPSTLAEINRKLLDLLPLGRFSCMILFRMDWHAGEFCVINAAMPDAFVLRADGGMVRFPSTGIPLGIQEDLGQPTMGRVRMVPGDCFFACSDGLTDLVGEAQILEAFHRGGPGGFTPLLRGLVKQRAGNLDLADDVSWCLWPFQPARKGGALALGAPVPGAQAGRTLALNLAFHPASVSYEELGSNLVGFLGRHGVTPHLAQNLALLLSETIINAVDHGSLELDSALKDVDFETYETERRARLAGGGLGEVRLEILVRYQPDGACSHLDVRVADPGAGFDWQKYLVELEDTPDRLSGRGLLLLKALGRDLAFNEAGNEVRFSLYPSKS